MRHGWLLIAALVGLLLLSTRRALAASRGDRDIMAMMVAGEATGEPREGQIAVAWTVRNRLDRAPRYGSFIQEVLGRPFQYTPIDNAIKQGAAAWQRLQRLVTPDIVAIVGGVLAGTIPDPLGATHFHADYVSPAWAGQLRFLGKIGRHLFYRDD